MRRILTLTLFTLSTGVLLATAAPGQGKMQGGACGPGTAGACGSQERGDCFTRKIFRTLSYVEMDPGQINDLRIAAMGYMKDMRGLQQSWMFPVDVLGKEEVDMKAYIKAMEQHQSRVAAVKADFLETVYLILNDDQRKAFKTHMTAMNRYKEMTGSCGVGPGCD